MGELICAGWLLDGTGEQHKDWGILFQGQQVRDVGPATELLQTYPDSKVREEPGWVIAPGYLDAHDHGRALSPFWFGVKDCPLELWIPRLGQVAVPVYEAALYDGIQLAKSGVTTVVHCHNPMNIAKMKEELLDTVRGYLDAGVRVALCPPYTDQNSLIYTGREEFSQTLEPDCVEVFSRMIQDEPMTLQEYFALVEELKQELAEEIQQKRVDVQLHPVGGQWCSDQALCEMRDYARKHGMRIHMHLLETKYQRIYSEKRWGKTMVSHMEDLGVLGPWLTIAHGIWLTAKDRRLLRDKRVKTVTNPSSNLRLGSGIFPLREMLDERIPCAVGLDGCSLDDDQDYGREFRLALHNPAIPGIRGQITPREIWNMAYQAGVQAVGSGLSPGRLQKGDLADFICFDGKVLDGPYASESLTWEEKILQRGSRMSVAAVYCGGKLIVERGKSCSGKEDQAAKRVGQFAQEKAKQGQPANEKLIHKIARFYTEWEEEQER